jgi:hypothetical protein
VTTAGATAAGLSHALNAETINAAENTIEYFMAISFLNV